MEKYRKISNKEQYKTLIDSGLFYEIYPELSGVWRLDKEVIRKQIER